MEEDESPHQLNCQKLILIDGYIECSLVGGEDGASAALVLLAPHLRCVLRCSGAGAEVLRSGTCRTL